MVQPFKWNQGKKGLIVGKVGRKGQGVDAVRGKPAAKRGEGCAAIGGNVAGRAAAGVEVEGLVVGEIGRDG